MKRLKPKRLTLLGRSESAVPAAPTPDILETFSNPSRRPYWIRFQSSDFTSLCPVTGQADFAEIQIDYQPRSRCIETKSLKFYLAAFRNERSFNEAVTNRILDDLVHVCAPRRMIVQAEFASRGGISLTIKATYPDESEKTAR